MNFSIKSFSRIIFLSIAILSTNSPNIYASNRVCDEVIVNDRNILFQGTYQPKSISIANDVKKIMEAMKKPNEKKAKGILGERVARHCIEHGAVTNNGRPMVSIITVLYNMGCETSKLYHDGSDQGIDDIFVVLRKDNRIDRRYYPCFHESKFDSGCQLKLQPTKQICKQLSIEWIGSNLKKAEKRTMKISSKCTGTLIKNCEECSDSFIAQLTWLKDKLKSGEFSRTASLLCKDGTFKIFSVGSK